MTQLIALAIRYRLGIDVATVINKIDVERMPIREIMEELYLRTKEFKQHIASEDFGVLADLAYDLIESIATNLPPTG